MSPSVEGNKELNMAEKTTAEIRESIINILKEIAPDDEKKKVDVLKDDVPFKEQLTMDSMDVLDVVLELKRLYKITIQDTEHQQLNTMNSTIALVQAKLKEKEE